MYGNGFMGGFILLPSDLDSLTMDVIWKALAVLCISVLGRFFFQWLMDISMSAKGFDIFRDYRLHVGALMRKAPMGYFFRAAFGKYSECTYNDSNRVGTIFHDGGH